LRGNINLDVCMVTNEKNADGKEFLKDTYCIHSLPESAIPFDVYGVEDFKVEDTYVQNPTTHKFQEDPKTDPALSKFQQEYEVFDLKIFHRKSRFTIRYLSYFLLLPNIFSGTVLMLRCPLQDRL
jgi:hypothetical protein